MNRPLGASLRELMERMGAQLDRAAYISRSSLLRRRYLAIEQLVATFDTSEQSSA